MNEREQSFVNSPMDEKRDILKSVFAAYTSLIEGNQKNAMENIMSAESLWGNNLNKFDDINRIKNEIKNENLGVALNLLKKIINNLIDNMAPSRSVGD